MNKAAFDELVGVIDEAIGLADCAVKAAEASALRKQPEEITLVKVAAARYRNTAVELIKTGTFRGYTADSLAKTLENAGPAEFLELMEKLASRAVFAIDTDTVAIGALVEQSDTTRAVGSHKDESRTDLWERSCKEAGLLQD